MTMPSRHVDREIVIRRLARGRDRSAFLRWSMIAFALVAVYSWTTSDFGLDDFASGRRLANVSRFLSELRPFPLHGQPWDWSVYFSWSWDLLTQRGLPASLTTLAMSVLAIVLAGAGAAALTLPAARSWASAEPYIPSPSKPAPVVRFLWSASAAVTRTLLIFVRAVPEYIWTFVLLAVVGPSAWAAILALALHNTGILGKLNAEVVENLPPEQLAALRALGASRRQLAIAAIVPAVLPRSLLFFFYRWETCVREATVLGMLGMVSIGFYIQDARARQHYDVMFFLILLSAAIVIVGDVVSAVVRRRVREA